ncbi:hypothetical protein [Nocardioides sp. R-C-SC26]|uniref:hypothetical protein n=1 Tax=Nocardioides sp. R-C-SC26 TaxID=2870414 RepID=UPI001E384FE9|nr:hypothetical protein [Nocardioides sp. R-C-SC26]
MSLSLLHTAVLRASEEVEHHGDPAVSPWVIGGLALAILLGMLFALMAFGGGRDHS